MKKILLVLFLVNCETIHNFVNKEEIEQKKRIDDEKILKLEQIKLENKKKFEQWEKDGEQMKIDAKLNEELIAKKDNLRKQNLIFFTKFDYGYRDFSDYLEFGIDNFTDKPIKYFSMFLVPFNRVQDEVDSPMNRKKWVKYIGDLESTDYFSDISATNIFWDNTVDCLKVREIEIEFADGTIKKFEDKDNLKKLFYDELSEDKFPSVCDF